LLHIGNIIDHLMSYVNLLFYVMKYSLNRTFCDRLLRQVNIYAKCIDRIMDIRRPYDIFIFLYLNEWFEW